MSKVYLKAIAAVLVIGLGGCFTVEVPEGNFFYPDSRVRAEKIDLPSAPPPAGSQTLSLSYDGGRIGTTRVRATAVPRPLILFCGGNLFRRSSGGGAVAEELSPFGDVLMFDYPGYGETDGTANFAGFEAVGRVIAREARAQADAEGRPLIAWGHSLGGIVCSAIANEVDADALVLETTTPSARAAIDEMVGLARPLVRVNMAPALAAVDVPGSLAGYRGRIVVLEAGKDDTLPPALSRRLARELRAKGHDVQTLVFPQAGHNDVGQQPDFEARVAAALTPR
ncbi:MAG: alpha/beta fold hydrolase [Brevundimonas sp.]|uniref:alpha/beta hydrolase family protein n=1 Tax=Brevundimonas sp. TaxID=1871086 RepID=UPI001A2B2CB8|nr:alpha/beta fold hydrolase [Brevundimonas sp.]MBJ7445912.1 alpha/beta fold hydrolase [Brevundimonas sp.]